MIAPRDDPRRDKRTIHVTKKWSWDPSQLTDETFFCGVPIYTFYPGNTKENGINSISNFDRQHWHRYCVKCLTGIIYSTGIEVDRDRARELLQRDYPEHK